MNGTVVWADEPAPARPHRVLLRLVWQEQRLDASTLDACARLAAAPPAGYDPARWRGPVPGAHAAAFRRVIGPDGTLSRAVTVTARHRRHQVLLRHDDAEPAERALAAKTRISVSWRGSG